MNYCARITTPASTLETDPLISVIAVDAGVVYKLEIDFPYGSCRFLHVQIFDGPTQVWPKTIGESYIGHGTLISFEEEYYKTNAPLEFTIKTWNEDDFYSHKLQARIFLLSEEQYTNRFLGGGGASGTVDIINTMMQASKSKIKMDAIEAFKFLGKRKG